MKENKRQILLKIILGVAGLVAVFLLGRGISYLMYGNLRETADSQTGEDAMPLPQTAMTEEELEALFRSAKVTATAGESASAEAGEPDGKDAGGARGEGEEADPEGGEIDFYYLKLLNRDIYAWITVPGTIIDYPIMQHPTDDTYYLHHNLDGSYGYPGCIYTESLNSKDFTDANTVIYGHNMKAGTMFAGLHQFEDRDFFDDNREVMIYLPEKTLRYRIFAAYVYDDRHLLHSFDFSDSGVYASYLESVYDIRDMSANIDRDMEVTKEDKIITLVTCMPGEANAEKRLLVQAVLEEQTGR